VFFGAEQQAQQPAHAGETVMTRKGVIRVAGLLQRLVRRFCLLQLALPFPFCLIRNQLTPALEPAISSTARIP
jgi:hypothetical protein